MPPPSRSGSHRSCCSGVPKVASGKQDRLCTLTVTATAAHRMASSSRTCRYTSYGWPPPPSDSGYGRPRRAPPPDDLEVLGREDPGGFRLGDAGRQLALGQLPGQVEQVSGLRTGQHPVHGHIELLATRGWDGAQAAATGP